MSNAIVLENQKQGNPESEWGLQNGANSSIEGFTTDISTNIDGTVQFKINTDAGQYRIDIYRLGYYDGNGARLVGSIEHSGAVSQPSPIVDLTRATVDAGNWSVTDTWSVPDDAVSGVYMAKLVREDGIEGENYIPFIIRDDDGHADIVFQTADTTWQAYNQWGGASLYASTLNTGVNRAYAVSYNRPTPTDGPNGVFGEEYAAIRFLEKNGYEVSYIAGVDTAHSGSELLEHQAFLSVGHDEYWSGGQRANVEAAKDAGVNLAFWGGNDMYWKTRWEPSLDATPDDFRTLVTYKSNATLDPTQEWTGTWRSPLNPSGPHPENALIGSLFMVNGFRADAITVDYNYSRYGFWRNTEVAELQPGQSLQLGPGTLGYEWNVQVDNGFRPAGLIRLSSTTLAVDFLAVDDGQQGPGIANHSLTLYRDDSGAIVFSAGSIYWASNLDSHNSGRFNSDLNVQQAMVNLFAEMGIQPETLQSDLVEGVASNDHTAPFTTISIVNGSLVVGSPIQVAGLAQDIGGLVAGVEFSGDGGLTWHEAKGWDQWTYAWTPEKIGLVTLEARAIDDSLNISTPAFAQLFVDFKDPGFDPGYYLATNPDVKAAGVDPYEHYLNQGWKEGRNPNAVFSTKDYFNANQDVAATGVNPFIHFETQGWKEGRNPSPSFDVELYLINNPDVAAVGINPLDHFLVYGSAEGRTDYKAVGYINEAAFGTEYYQFQNPDVAASGIDPYSHYFEQGWTERRNPNPYFDTNYYLTQNPDVAQAGVNPLWHYDVIGWKEGRDPSAQFDTQAYLLANPDVAAADLDPLYHYLVAGINEGRDPLGGTIT